MRGYGRLDMGALVTFRRISRICVELVCFVIISKLVAPLVMGNQKTCELVKSQISKI